MKPVGKPDALIGHVRLCVQQMLACSVGGESHRGKSQKPRSLDSREEGNQISETYRRHHLWGDGEPLGRNESERGGGLESAYPGAESSTGGRRQHGSSHLTEAASHSGGVIAAARWQGRAKQLEKPSSPRREIGGAGKPYNRRPREIGGR
jgi:hypothetical protein